MMNNIISLCILTYIFGSCFFFGYGYSSRDCTLYLGTTEDELSFINNYFITAEDNYMLTATCRCYYKKPSIKYATEASPLYKKIADTTKNCTSNFDVCNELTSISDADYKNIYLELRLINYPMNVSTVIVCGNSVDNYAPALFIAINKTDTDITPFSSQVVLPSTTTSATIMPPSQSPTPSLSIQDLMSSTRSSTSITPQSSCTPESTVTVNSCAYATATPDPTILPETRKIIEDLESDRDKYKDDRDKYILCLGVAIGVMLLIITVLSLIIFRMCRTRNRVYDVNAKRKDTTDDSTPNQESDK